MTVAYDFAGIYIIICPFPYMENGEFLQERKKSDIKNNESSIKNSISLFKNEKILASILLFIPFYLEKMQLTMYLRNTA